MYWLQGDWASLRGLILFMVATDQPEVMPGVISRTGHIRPKQGACFTNWCVSNLLPAGRKDAKTEDSVSPTPSAAGGATPPKAGPAAPGGLPATHFGDGDKRPGPEFCAGDSCQGTVISHAAHSLTVRVAKNYDHSITDHAAIQEFPTG